MSWLDSILPAGQVNVPNPYQLGHQAGADRGAYGGIQNLNQYNLGGQNLGEYGQLAQQGVNNPFAQQYQQGAGQAGQMGQAAGMGAYGAGGQLMGAGQGALPDVQALLTLGFDPQNALYARTAQQVQDQNAARAAQSGLGGTPYGQGVQNQANQNFNIDWQNNQLQRAAMGAGAAGNLLGSAGGAIGQGAGLQSGGVQEYLQGAALPYNTYAGINQNQRNILDQASAYGQGAAKIPQQQIQDYLAYLNQGNQNQQTQISAQQLNLAKQKELFGEAATIGQDIGQMAMGMPPGMGGGGMGGGMGGGGGMFANPFAGFFGGSPANYGGMSNPYAGMGPGSNPTW